MDAIPRITYFDIRGRAEPIRLLLEEVAVAYDDVRVSGEDWGELKQRTPFGQLPSFGRGDWKMFQSHAIYRHLARTYDLYGADNRQRRQCDIAMEALRDAKDELGSVFWRPDFESEREGFVGRELPARLDALTRFFGKKLAAVGFWAGPSFTIADILGFAYLDDVECLFPGSLAAFEALAGFRLEFAARPQVAAYLASGRRPEAVQYGPRGKIYPHGHSPQ